MSRDPEEDRVPTDPEDYNDLQTYLEGDTVQAAAAAVRLDRRAVESGQMSLALFLYQHPDAWPHPVPGGVMKGLLPSPLSYDPLPLCPHPRAATELHAGRTTYRRRRESTGRLRLRRGRSVPWVVLRCPDCRTWAGQVEIPGLVTDLRLPPCVVPTTPGTPDARNGVRPWE